MSLADRNSMQTLTGWSKVANMCINNYAQYTPRPTKRALFYKLRSDSKILQTFLFITATLSNGEILYLAYMYKSNDCLLLGPLIYNKFL